MKQPPEKRAFNWMELHEKMKTTSQKIGKDWIPGKEEKKKILHERALKLSGNTEKEPAASDFLEVIEFILAHEKYGIESTLVREVFPLKTITRIPGLPSFILGLANLRGEVIPVIDLKRLFSLPEAGLTDLDKLIVLQAEDIEIGILADVIAGVKSIRRDDIQPPLLTIPGIHTNWMKGITSDHMVIIDAMKFLNSQIFGNHE